MYNKKHLYTPKLNNWCKCLRTNWANRYKPINDIVEQPLLNAAKFRTQPYINSIKKNTIKTDAYILGVEDSMKAFRMGESAYKIKASSIN